MGERKQEVSNGGRGRKKRKRNDVVGKGRREGREERNGREWWREMGTGGEVGERIT